MKRSRRTHKLASEVARQIFQVYDSVLEIAWNPDGSKIAVKESTAWELFAELRRGGWFPASRKIRTAGWQKVARGGAGDHSVS